MRRYSSGGQLSDKAFDSVLLLSSTLSNDPRFAARQSQSARHRHNPKSAIPAFYFIKRLDSYPFWLDSLYLSIFGLIWRVTRSAS
jgi:hypothetical protein